MDEKPDKLRIIQNKLEGRQNFLVSEDIVGMVENEYKETISSSIPNTWLECFGSCLGSFKMHLEVLKRSTEKQILSLEEINRKLIFCGKIYDYIDKLRKEYDENITDLPEPIKEGLRKALLCLNDLSCSGEGLDF